MTKEQQRICMELTKLMGYHSFVKSGNRCRGKWSGTTDYSLTFDGKTPLYLSNGMAHFYETVQERIDMLKMFEANKQVMLELIREQVKKDNLTSQKEGLLPIIVKSIGMNKSTEHYLLWSYITIEVGGIEFDFIETGLCYAIKGNTLNEHISSNMNRATRTAGAVKEPTFVFLNVRYSHVDRLHKINT